MNSNECPNCGAEDYKFVSGWQNEEPIEPDEGWCDKCGFHYVEHCKDPLAEQIARFNQQEIDPMTDETALAVFTPIENTLANYRAEAEAIEFDYETPEGNKDARSFVYKIRLVKGSIDRVHRDAKAEALAFGRRLDARKNELKKELDGIIAIHGAPLLLIEERKAKEEAERLRKIQEEEERAAAERAAEHEATKKKLAEAEEQIAIEKQKEYDRQAEAERIERDKRIAEEAKAQAEKEHQEQVEELERRRQRDVAAAKEKAETEAREKALAERERLEAEEATKKRAEEKERKRQENKKHREKIHQEINDRLEQLVHDVDELNDLYEALVAGTIPHVKIEY